MASFERLQREDADVMALDPSAFDLPFSTIYTPQRPISWVQGWDLIHGRPVWIARDLAISPAGEGVCAGVETNGLASGNSFTEATVHALCEVIERDAVAHAYFADALGAPEDEHRPAVRMIDVATLPSEAMGWHDRLRALGREIHVRDVTNDNGVHVFAVRLIDPFFPNGARGFVGYGAALNPVRAVMRAFTEAVQAHTTHVVGNRDEYEVGGATSDRDHRVLRNIASCWPERRWPFPRLEPQRQPADLLAELDTLVERLTIAGFRHCAVVDLTREDLQVPVVRVAVPGLAFPYGLTQRRPSPRLLAQLV
jgi:ribosomal protein S12 methylthiotransferase accessory factor